MTRLKNEQLPAGFLSRRELRTVEKFSEAFIEGERVISTAEIAANIDKQLARLQSNRKQSLRLVLFLVEYILPLLSFWRPFSSMSLAQRRKFIDMHLADHEAYFRGKGHLNVIKEYLKAVRRRTLRDLSRLKALFMAGYYGDPRVNQSIHFTAVPERERFQPQPGEKLKLTGLALLNLYQPAASDHELECDVCVIGSGAGGAVVAYHAAAAGKNVILLEEGNHVRAQEMNHNVGDMTALLYKDGGLQTTVDLDMSIMQGKCLGGTTVINNAICLRLNDADLYEIHQPDIYERWRQLGAPIDAKKLEASYERVEKMINVHRISPKITSKNADVLLEGWKRLVAQGEGDAAFTHNLFKKNYKDCLGCGYCNFGCPYERKMSMLETYIPAAIQHGARAIANCHAVKIATAGKQTRGVHCRLQDGRRFFVRAKKVVVSCGAVGSSVLLMNSGIRRNVGERFSFNAAALMLARFREPINSFDGVQMPGYVDTGDAMLETWFSPPMAMAGIMPGWFNTHFERMRAFDHFACAGVLIGTDCNARVKRAAFLRNMFGPVDYAMTPADLEKLRRGMILLAQVYFAYGAEAVYPASFVDLEMKASDFKSAAAIDSFIHAKVRQPDDLLLNSSHPQGGNAMSDNPAIGVVDSRFKVHGFDNLFVCDASVFPTTIRINPQLTIMAMADYASHLSII